MFHAGRRDRLLYLDQHSAIWLNNVDAYACFEDGGETRMRLYSGRWPTLLGAACYSRSISMEVR